MDNPVVLVVDDDSTTCRVLQQVLEREAYRVMTVGDVASALARLASDPIDIVLLDGALTHAGGLDVCRAMRTREAGGYLPVVVLAGRADALPPRDGVTASADDYICKPLDPREALDRVRVWARVRRRVRAYQDQLADAYAALATVNRQREEFLSLIAHELRQPIAAISRMAEALADAPGIAPPEQRAFEHLLTQSHSLARLADDLVAIAQLESGGFRLQPSLVDLGVLVSELARGVTEWERVRVRQPDGPVRVEADPQRLGQAIGNLIDNALKYSSAPSPVTITLRPSDTEVLIEVQDEGIGLAADEIPRLFQKYGRLRNDRTRKVAGVGLGLYLTRLLIEGHGGRILVESAGPTQGATFTIALPRVAPASVPVAQPLAGGMAPSRAASSIG